MKHALFMAGIAVLAIACNKEKAAEFTPADESGRVPILFEIPVSEFSASTKAVTDVTTATLSSINVSATTGSAGSEEAKFTNATFTKGSSYYTGDQYWPSTNQNYHFYAANTDLQLVSGYEVISPTSAETDLVCSFLESPTYKTSNKITLSHIFARITNVTVEASSGYTLSDVSVKIYPLIPAIGTTYRLRDKSWQGTTQGAGIELTNGASGTKSNDFMFVPGKYKLKASWTASKGNYSQSFSVESSEQTFTAGVKTAITCTMGGSASSINFTLAVNEWVSNTINVSF